MNKFMTGLSRRDMLRAASVGTLGIAAGGVTGAGLFLKPGSSQAATIDVHSMFDGIKGYSSEDLSVSYEPVDGADPINLDYRIERFNTTGTVTGEDWSWTRVREQDSQRLLLSARAPKAAIDLIKADDATGVDDLVIEVVEPTGQHESFTFDDSTGHGRRLLADAPDLPDSSITWNNHRYSRVYRSFAVWSSLGAAIYNRTGFSSAGNFTRRILRLVEYQPLNDSWFTSTWRTNIEAGNELQRRLTRIETIWTNFTAAITIGARPAAISGFLASGAAATGKVISEGGAIVAGTANPVALMGLSLTGFIFSGYALGLLVEHMYEVTRLYNYIGEGIDGGTIWGIQDPGF